MTYEITGRENPLTREDTETGQSCSHTMRGASAAVRDGFPGKRKQRTAADSSPGRLLTNRLLVALPEEEFAHIAPHLEPVSLASGEDLSEFGESINFAYFPETAVISHLHVMADGSVTEAVMIGRDGMTGLSAIFNSTRPVHWTQATVGGSALRIRTEALLQEFSRGGALQRLLLSYAGERLAQLSQRAVCNGRHRVEERLCSWLLMVHDRAGEDRLPLTHEQIARHLGVRRAGITRTASDLRDQGLVSYSRGHLRILDRAALEAATCECYRVLGRLNGEAGRKTGWPSPSASLQTETFHYSPSRKDD